MMECKPREVRKGKTRESIDPSGNNWNKNQSFFFKNYFMDHESLLNKCFEFDWSCSKIPKLIKDPKD